MPICENCNDPCAGLKTLDPVTFVVGACGLLVFGATVASFIFFSGAFVTRWVCIPLRCVSRAMLSVGDAVSGAGRVLLDLTEEGIRQTDFLEEKDTTCQYAPTKPDHSWNFLQNLAALLFWGCVVGCMAMVWEAVSCSAQNFVTTHVEL